MGKKIRKKTLMRKFILLAIAAFLAATSTFAQQSRQSQHTPDGILHENMVASFSGLAYNWVYGWYNISSDASAASIVEGTDGNIYVKGLVPNFLGDAFWVKAEPIGGGGRYVIHRQVAGEYPSYNEVDYISRLVYSDAQGSFVEATNTDLFLTYSGGVLTLDPAGIDASGLPSYAYGLVSDYYEVPTPEAGYGYYWNLTIREENGQIVELPEGAEVETLVLQHQEGSKDVRVAFFGDKVYVNSYSNLPGWYVGTIHGNKVTFKNGQFLGLDPYYDSYEWLITAHLYEAYDEENGEYYTAAEIVDEVVFDYDAATKTMTAPEDAALFINGAKNRIYYAERYMSPKFFVFKEVPAVPADPVITRYWDYDDNYGNAELDFTISSFDVNGNYMTPSKLTYSLYVDNELFEFDPVEYEGLAEPITEIPYGVAPDSNIGTTWLCIFFRPMENIGLQTIYRGADVEQRSNIVYYDLKTQEVYTEPYSNPVTAIKGVNTQQQDRVVYYDAAGRRVQANAKGFVLKTVTTADGTQKTVKVIRK